MRVVMVAAECVPFAKAGGLGDVIGALPIQLERLGIEVSILLPRYRSIELQKYGFEPFPVSGEMRVPFGWEELTYDVQVSVLPGTSIKVFLIGNDRFFNRDGLYFDPVTGRDFPDQVDRWIFFSRASMEVMGIRMSCPCCRFTARVRSRCSWSTASARCAAP